MVIKKPYAFLIKHFRLIHGLLFVMLLYLTTKAVSIYGFFNDYASSHSYLNQANLASLYVNPLIYVITIASVLVFLVIFLILSLKEKSNRIYLAGILYYIVLFIFFIYIHSVFKGLEETSLDVETVRFFRDICLIVLIPQVIFLFIMIGRTLGFNLKQFEFKKDLEEMEIDVSDNEEVELTLGNDSYKVARTFRKFIRLTKYFVIENKLFVIAVSSILIFALSIFVYTRINVYKEAHRSGENIQVKGLTYSVTNSYLTKADINNIVQNEDYGYLLININVKNNTSEDYPLNRDTFRLKIKDDLINPEYGIVNKFYDLGNVFEPTKIGAEKTNEYLVIFKIKKENMYDSEYLFRIKNIILNNNNSSYYEDIIVKPTDLDNSIDKGNKNIPTKVDFSDSLLKKSTLEINSFDIEDKFKESFKYTVDNEIKNGTYSIIPQSSDNGAVTIIRFKGRLTLDEDLYLNNIIKEPSDLYALYGVIEYRYQGEYRKAKLNKLDVDFNKQTNSYLTVPKEVKEANKINLVILVRGVKYTFNLK